jgi:hypothetical protein
VWINEIVGNPVREHEIPVKIGSAKGVKEEYWEYEPVDQSVAKIASLNVTIV